MSSQVPSRKTSVNKSSTRLLPTLVQDETCFQKQPIPRKYRKIPRRVDHEPIRFNFPQSISKNYRFKSTDSIEEYRSPFKIGKSLHQNANKTIESRKLLFHSSKKNILEKENQHFSKMSDDVGRETFYNAYTHKTKTEHYRASRSMMSTILEDLDRYVLIPKGIESLRQSQHKKILFKREALNNNNRLRLIGNVMEKSGNYSDVDLSNNFLKQGSSKMIIDKMIGVENINLSGNAIGAVGIASFASLFSDPSCNIKNLNLSNNNLSDHLISSLVKSIHKYPLQVLDVSQNHVNKKTCVQLKTMIKANHIVELYLGWNKLDSDCALQLTEAVRQNSSLKFLDLALNSIGKSVKLKESLCKMIIKNRNLIHLNLSYCSLTQSQYQAISSSLDQNHSLIGLHCEGSSVFLDSRGYLNVTPFNKTFYESETISKYPLKYCKQSRSRLPICWVCQGWRQFRFDIKLEKEKQYFIHFSFQNYEKTEIQKYGAMHAFKRFVPPIQFNFFLSYYKQGKITVILLDKYQKRKANISWNNQIIEEVNIHSQKQQIDYKDLNTDVLPRALPRINQQYCRRPTDY